MPSRAFLRFAGVCAMVACPVALTSFFLLPVAFAGDFDAVFVPALAIGHASVQPGLVRWAWTLDIVGYYFLLLPSVLVLAERFRATHPFAATLGERAAYGYMITGTTGAAILAGTTDLFTRWKAADPAGRVVIAEVYTTLFQMVDRGLWNTLCMSLLAVWLFAGGGLLARSHRRLGLVMTALGACSALDVFGGLIGVEAVSMGGLYGYLFGFPLWSAALGATLLKESRGA